MLLSVVFPPVGAAIAVYYAAEGIYDSYEIGQTLYALLSGEDPNTGEELSDKELAGMMGGLLGGFVGGMVGGFFGMRTGQYIKSTCETRPDNPPVPLVSNSHN